MCGRCCDTERITAAALICGLKGQQGHSPRQRLFLLSVWTFSSFCVDRKKKQERTANTLRRRTNGLSGVWLRNSRLRRSDSPRPRRHRKASFVTDGSRYRSPSQHPATCRGRLTYKAVLIMISSFRIGLNLRNLDKITSTLLFELSYIIFRAYPLQLFGLCWTQNNRGHIHGRCEQVWTSDVACNNYHNDENIALSHK